MAWDRVHTINEYYDGPRLGLADVDGVPHIHEAEFDHSSEEYGDTFLFRRSTKAFSPSSSKTGTFGCAGTQHLRGARSLSNLTLHCRKIARGMRFSGPQLGIACGLSARRRGI